MDIGQSFKRMAQLGAAVGQMLADDVIDNIRYGVESLDEPECPVSFGDLSDVTNNDMRGFSVDGVHALDTDRSGSSNLCLFSATGGGKTSVCLLNQLLRMDNASVIIHDSSSTVMPITAPRLVSLGYNIHSVNFSDILNSSSINFLDYIETDQDANSLAHHLMTTSQGSGKGDPFFIISGSNLLSFSFRLVKRMGKDHQHMGTVCLVLNLLGTKSAPDKPVGSGLSKVVVKYCNDKLFLEFKAMLSNGSDKTMGSILLSAQAALEYWTSDALCRAMAQTTVHFDTFRKRKQILYIQTSTYDSLYYKNLTSITLELALKALMKEVPKDGLPVYMLIDEASTLELKSLSQVVSNSRKYNIKNLLCFQNPSQVITAYGKEAAQNIFANSAQLYYGHQDLATAKELSELFGKRSVVGRDGKKNTEYLMDAQEIVRMPKDKGLLVCRNRPYRLTLKPWFQQPLIRIRSKGEPYQFINPFIPKTVPLIPLP